MKELLAQIDKAWQGIQKLQLEPSKHNLVIIADTLTALEQAYNVLKAADEKAQEKQEEEEKQDADA